MKIINIIFNNARGGLEQVFIDYTEMLQKEGHEVLALIPQNAKFLPDLKEVTKNIRVSRFIRARYFKFLLKNELHGIFNTEKPDLVIFHNDRNLDIAKKASKGLFPIVAINHGCKIRNMLQADHIMSVNSMIAAKIAKMGYKKENITIIGNMTKI